MRYDIDKKHYRINVYGTTGEIRNMIIALDEVITQGNSMCMLDLDGLEKITMAKEFNFTITQRIYYDNQSLLYVPNVTYSARKFWLDILEKNFEKARKLVED